MARKTSKMEIIVAPDSQVGTSERVSSNQKVHQGTVFFAKVIIPTYDNPATTKVNIVDDEGDIIYSFADLVMGSTNIISDFQCPIIEQEYITVELNEVPGGLVDYTIYVTLYYESDYR